LFLSAGLAQNAKSKLNVTAVWESSGELVERAEVSVQSIEALEAGAATGARTQFDLPYGVYWITVQAPGTLAERVVVQANRPLLEQVVGLRLDPNIDGLRYGELRLKWSVPPPDAIWLRLIGKHSSAIHTAYERQGTQLRVGSVRFGDYLLFLRTPDGCLVSEITQNQESQTWTVPTPIRGSCATSAPRAAPATKKSAVRRKKK
jgi:hypothetical protein